MNNVLASGWDNVELIGIFAGVFIFVSFLFKKELIIRMVNVCGGILFLTYGIIINAISVYVVNGLLVLLQIIYITYDIVLNKKRKKEGYFVDKVSNFKKGLTAEQLKEFQEIEKEYKEKLEAAKKNTNDK